MLNILSVSPKDEIEKVLNKYGYRILGKNQKENILIRMDGKEHLGTLVADYVVKKENRSYAVVVERGEGDFDPTRPALRRQLIEYDRAFGLNGVLLVDAQAGIIHRVSFGFPREKNIDFYFQFLIAIFIIFGVIGVIWLMVMVKLF